MSWFLRTVFLFSAIVLVINPEAPQNIMQWWASNPQLKKTPTSQGRVSNAYVLPEDQWLNFPLSQRGSRTRIIINAVGDKDLLAPASEALPFCVEYRFLDRNKNILRRGKYHMHTRIDLSEDNIQAELANAAENEVLLPARLATWQIEGMPVKSRPRFMQLRACDLGSPLLRLVSRAYTLQEDDVPLSAWKRLKPEELKQMSRVNVYPPELFTAQEQLQLLRSSWRPVSPSGLPGQSWDLERLVVPPTEEQPPPPAGLGALPGPIFHRGQETGVSIPDLQKIRVNLLELPEDSASAPSHLHLIWYADSGLVQEFNLQAPENSLEFNPEESGHLVLSATTHAAFTLEGITAAGDQIELTPQRGFLRAWPVAPEQLQFHMLEKRSYPIRIQAWTHTSKARHTGIDYLFVSASGSTLQEGKLPLKWEDDKRSYSDALTPSAQRYSEDLTHAEIMTAEVFLNKPVGASKLILSGSESAHVALSNRPLDRPYEVHIPEDTLDIPTRDKNRPLWFALKPVNAEELYRTNNSILLERLPPARHPDPEIEADRYIWESLIPAGAWYGDQALIPGQIATPIRNQALAAHYTRVPFNNAIPLDLHSEQGYARVRPRLVYMLENTPPAGTQLDVYMDAQLQEGLTLNARQGRIVLPALDTGRHTLRLETETKGHAYISNWKRSGKLLRLRTMSRLEDTLNYEIVRQAPEEQMTLVFHPLAARDRSLPPEESVLEIEIAAGSRPASPQLSMTIPLRRYHIAAQEETIPLLHSGSFVGQGRKVYFPLGADTYKNHCSIKIKHVSGPQGYVQLYRLIPGLSQKELWQWLEH